MLCHLTSSRSSAEGSEEGSSIQDRYSSSRLRTDLVRLKLSAWENLLHAKESPFQTFEEPLETPYHDRGTR